MRNRKKYVKSLHEQAFLTMKAKQRFGQSKKADKKAGISADGIYSYNTFKTYMQHINKFLRFVKHEHPEATNLRKARKYTLEWLKDLEAQTDAKGNPRYSAFTLHTAAKSLAKLYGITQADNDYYTPPRRERSEIKRSRTAVDMDKHFSVTNNAELINFCRGTGGRRSELKKLTCKDLVSREALERYMSKYESKPVDSRTERESLIASVCRDALSFPDCKYFVHFVGKGGRQRYAPIIGVHASDIVKRIHDTPEGQKVWQHIHAAADVHSYRGDYATAIYRLYARPIESLPYVDTNKRGAIKRYQPDVYICRKDEAGKRLDRKAMEKASKALGHNRIEIVANNYIRGI